MESARAPQLLARPRLDTKNTGGPAPMWPLDMGFGIGLHPPSPTPGAGQAGLEVQGALGKVT